MRAAIYHAAGGPITIEEVPRPEPPAHGALIRVEATGVCRSDWHAWMGHDPGITLPQVPGHEFAGRIAELGGEVKGWSIGDRVTVPFSSGCGVCPVCERGDTHLCDAQYQPGFDGWGSFAEFVAISYAQTNLVRLPDELDVVDAAALGCRFMTAFHALVNRAGPEPGQWLTVHGCGGVGLSAVHIGQALGLRVIAVDLDPAKLDAALELGAEAAIDARHEDAVTATLALTAGGSAVSIDAVGSGQTVANSINCLRPGGRHIQIGLVDHLGTALPIPMARVIAKELEVVGAHGMPADRYPGLLAMVAQGRVDPGRLVKKVLRLNEAPAELEAMSTFDTVGFSVVRL